MGMGKIFIGKCGKDAIKKGCSKAGSQGGGGIATGIVPIVGVE